MKILTILVITFLYLFISVSAEDKEVDLFLDNPDFKPSEWPKLLAPTKEQLKKFEAIDLTSKKGLDGVFIRFLWEPTFDSPLLITASKTPKGKILSVKKMSGKGGYDWGKVKLDKTFKITDDQWGKIVTLSMVNGARKPSKNFKGMMKDNFIAAMSGLDGSRWYLEVIDAKGYTVEGLPNPVEEGGKALVIKELGVDLKPYVEVCLELLRISKIKVDLIY